jgi:glycerophosphoryl diester phosphodiesterase
MLLKDLLPLINADVKLLIEIKPIDGNGKECVQAVERLLTFYPRHYIACLDISILKEVKRLNPLRKTVYLLAFALGNWYDYDCVDIYAIEQSFVSEENVELAHKNGSQIFVWNVNDEEDAFRYLEIGVDGLITNYPKKILSTVNSSQLQIQSENLLNFFKVSL